MTGVLSRAFKEAKPEILVLGPLCGESVVYLAGRGARAHVEPVDLPQPLPARRPGEPAAPVEPLRFDLPDQAFHLVVAWEMLDFVPPDRLGEVGAELRRIRLDGRGLWHDNWGGARARADEHGIARIEGIPWVPGALLEAEVAWAPPAEAGGARSSRNANYEIDARLDVTTRVFTGREVITWRNIMAHPTSEVRLHLYYNAWRNDRSSYMRSARLSGRPLGLSAFHRTWFSFWTGRRSATSSTKGLSS